MDKQIQKKDKKILLQTSSSEAAGIPRKNPNLGKNSHEIIRFSSNGHDGVAFHPLGNTIASSRNEDILLWDLKGSCQNILKGHKSQVCHVAFSFDGSILASFSNHYANESLRLWSTSSGKPLGIPEEHYNVCSIAFSRDDKYIALGCSDSTIRILKSPDWIHLRTLTGHKGQVGALVFSNDGKYLYSGSHDCLLRVWETTGWICTMKKEYKHAVTCIAVSPKSEKIAVGIYPSTVYLRDAVTFKFLVKLRIPEEKYLPYMWSLAFSPDGKIIAGGFPHHVRLWNTETGGFIKVLKGDKGFVHSLTFSPVCENKNKTILISCAQNGELHYWDLETYSLLVTNHQPDKGFLYSIPPDEYFQESLFWTDRADLITVYAEKPDGKREVVSDKERDCYIDTHNRKLLVQARLCGDLKKYDDLAKGAQKVTESYNKQSQIKYSIMIKELPPRNNFE